MTKFTVLPKTIFTLSITSKSTLVYMHLLDRYRLSFANDWYDESGIYVYYSISNIENAIGCSRPTAIKILQELENNGYIVKRNIKGKPTKIYLVDNEFTKFALENVSKAKKRIIDINAVEQTEEENIEKASENIEIEEQNIEETSEITEIASTNIEQKEENIETIFVETIGRKPDKSFVRTVKKKKYDKKIKIEIIKEIIRQASEKAKKPEAYILWYLGQTIAPQSTSKQTEQQPSEYDLEWRIKFEKRKASPDEDIIKKCESMLELIKEKQREKEAQKPLQRWELEWLIEQEQYRLDNGMDTDANKILEYRSMLDELINQSTS